MYCRPSTTSTHGRPLELLLLLLLLLLVADAAGAAQE
jgi:hypothetical protein